MAIKNNQDELIKDIWFISRIKEVADSRLFVQQFDNNGVPNDDTSRFDAEINLGSSLFDDFYLYGFNYTLRFLNLPTNDPHIGIVISRYQLTDNTWNGNGQIQQEGIIHFDAYKSFPANDSINFDPPRLIRQSEKIHVALFLQNNTGGSFSNDPYLHLTLYYRSLNDIARKISL